MCLLHICIPTKDIYIYNVSALNIDTKLLFNRNLYSPNLLL